MLGGIRRLLEMQGEIQEMVGSCFVVVVDRQETGACGILHEAVSVSFPKTLNIVSRQILLFVF